MSMAWYDMIAKRNGGYKSDAVYKIQGQSGEVVFEDRVIGLIKQSKDVLDAGCGHGAFTLKMSDYAEHIIGFDNSKELIKIAKATLKSTNKNNLKFVMAGTKDKDGLPFEDEVFDLIYVRRGPTSILKHSNLLKENGVMIGIHSAAKDLVQKRLVESGLRDIKIDLFEEAIRIYPNPGEFQKDLSSQHGNLDYTLEENKEKFEHILKENTVNGVIQQKEWRYIWSGRK